MLNPLDKQAIARQFGRAAALYDGSAHIQAQVATQMVARLQAMGLPPAARVLEIGCGTGLVTRGALASLDIGQWLATDLSPSMVAATRGHLPNETRLLTLAMDGEQPALAGGVDLVCSSLALQWFPDPAAALAAWRGLLRPGGRLLVATLADGTFAEWHDAQRRAGGTPVGPDYAAVETMRGWLPGLSVEAVALREHHTGARAFLDGLRRIGADYSPRHAGAGTLRRAMRALEAVGPVAITYQVAWLHAAADAIDNA